MLCPKCQHRNPDENRFCGQCGCDLSKVDRTIYPREGYDDLPFFSDLEPQVPTSRDEIPPVSDSESGPPHTEPAVLSREEIRERTPVPPREVPRPRSGGIIFDLEPRESERFVISDKNTEQEAAPPRRSEAIHGPSFLGLGDSGEPDFLDDLDEPRSHARRNWLLVALAIVIALGVVEWRNIRQTGMEFAGTMKLNLPSKMGQQPKPAETASTDDHSESGPANDGKPEILVNPVNNGAPSDKTQSQPTDSHAANNAAGATGNAAAQQGSTPPPSEPPTADSAKDNTPSSDQKGADVKQQEKAKNTTSPVGTSDNTDNSANDNAPTSEHMQSPTKTASSRSARSKSPRPTPTEPRAGAEELARADQASSPETAAKWLWASTSKGNLDAPVRLADMYARGEGVPKDCEQATVLLRSSARRGNPRASARLGMYYATGQCVQQDRPQAWHWLSLAYQHDPASDWIRQYREHLWSRMTPQERARAGNGPTASASE